MTLPDQPSDPRPRLELVLPSLNFLLIALVFAGSGAAMWHGLVSGKIAVMVFVVSGWVVSLCLHEFGHALTAYLGGDAAIAKTGYLDLDPLKYTDPALSIILPIVFVLLGGIGLPGGAVYIRAGMLRSGPWRSAVAAAGPLANLACLLALGALYAALATDPSLPDSALSLAAGIGALAFFQATAIVLNLLPVPGLDGFGIVEPLMSRTAAIKAREVGPAAVLLLFVLLWWTSAGTILFRIGARCVIALGIDPDAIQAGLAMMRVF